MSEEGIGALNKKNTTAKCQSIEHQKEEDSFKELELYSMTLTGGMIIANNNSQGGF